MRRLPRPGPGPLAAGVVAVAVGLVVLFGRFLSGDGGADVDLGSLAAGTPTSTTSTIAPVTTTTTVVASTTVPEPTSTTRAASPPTTSRRAAAPTTTSTIRPLVATVTAIPTTTSPPATTATTLAPTTTSRPATGTRQGSVEAEVVRLTNRDRTANGVPALTRNSCLDGAASQWAAHMAQTGEKAHNSQSGALVQGCRGPAAYWGDNIGWWDPCSAAEMENWWMNSPGHRSNVVNANYTVIGVAVIPGVQGYCWFQVLFGS